MKLCIGQPEINKTGGKARLCCRITWETGSYDMWYEVDACFEEYLCAERADAFLLAVLPYAMRQAIDIRVDAVLSEQLYYQLTMIYIPALAKNTKSYHSIRLECDDLDNRVLASQNATGTGFSGGVDSFYTVCTHLQSTAKRYNLTHLTFFNVGASGDAGGEESRRLFLERLIPCRAFAEENGFVFVTVDSNISEFLQYEHLHTHTIRSLSAVMALQKLFSVYYYSSSSTFREFALTRGDEAAGFFDLMSVHCLSNENTRFYITGPNENRVEKCAAIAGYPPSYRYLNVCLSEGKNCSLCEKCLRTMLALYAVGKLELYSAVFDVAGFMAHLNKKLAAVIENSGDRNYREIRKAMNENGVKIPFGARVLGFVMRITRLFPNFRKRLARSKLLRSLYHKI